MKIIDLLNKIANGEEVPKKINYKENIYEYYKSSETIDYRYLDEETQGYGCLSSCIDYDTFSCLNDEVEVIEDNKKIEHIGKKYDITDFKREYPKVAELVKDLNNKQYEIIDKLNEVLNDKD